MENKSGPMDPKTKTKNRNGIYDKYKDYEYWDVIEKAVKNLEKNNDFILQTHTDIIVGYIVKELINQKIKNDM